MKRVAENSLDDVDMVLAAQWAAPESFPFSHFELKRSEFDATTLAKGFDEMDLPASNVELEIHDGIAFLAIHRFMGRNTEDSIRNALARVVESKCSGLVVDLRGNPGGAFAIVPLIEGLIAEPAFAGVFVTQAGRRAYPDGPSVEVIDALPEWHERSLIAWWEALGKERLIKVVVRPVEHPYGGPVAVLVDGETESAAELATQVLQSIGRVIVVGAQTPGKMLSAAHFDVGDGFVLSLPVADYLAQGRLRIEGVGITPDIVVDPSLAKDAAVAELSRAVAQASSGTAQP
jgi:C-terminal processing protease CtpA/Prc